MTSKSSIIGSIDDLSDGDINRLFYAARSEASDCFDQAVLMTAFFEPSTRTRLSFEMAALRLGMKTLTYSPENSSQQKGETELDTINNLLALGPAILVIRSKNLLCVDQFAPHRSSIINGGDGTNEHPTQSLTDCFTLINYWQVDDFAHKTILIVGDVAHSRVARSNIKLMKRMGAKVVVLAPSCFMLQDDVGQDYELGSFDELSYPVDAVMCLRVQKERMNHESLLDDKEYHRRFGLSMSRFLDLGNKTVILHPGPMNIGIEIDRDVAVHERSLILEQVTYGVSVRASLMRFCLLGGL